METKRVAKVVKKIKLTEQGSDFAYWQAQSPQARLEALEGICREYPEWKYSTEPGFQRVYRIVKR